MICFKLGFIFILVFLLFHFHNRIFIFYFILLAVYIIATSTADIHIISLGLACLWKILESPFINKFQNINDGKDLSELIYLYLYANFRKRSYSSTNYCTQINTNKLTAVHNGVLVARKILHGLIGSWTSMQSLLLFLYSIKNVFSQTGGGVREAPPLATPPHTFSCKGPLPPQTTTLDK